VSKKVRYTIIVNRHLHDVLAVLPEYEELLRPQRGGYSFEAVGEMTRITLTSPDPIQSLFNLDAPLNLIDEQLAGLSRLKALLDRAAA
jgi:hypothetical protein